MEIVEWRAVQDFPDYEISNDGRLRSWRWRCDGKGGRRSAPLECRGSPHPKGYTFFTLRKPGLPGRYVRTAHRLVAGAFIPNPDALPDVAHNDGNPRNGRADNLRWSTHRDNQMDMRKHGTMQDGERCVTAKLTAAQVSEIRAALQNAKRGDGRRLARQYGLSVSQISRIKNGRRWLAAHAFHCSESEALNTERQ